jgi:hypothetical protein
MSLSKSSPGFSDFDELENLGLLDDAIASACERRIIAAKQSDCLQELLDEEASAITGGLSKGSITPISKPTSLPFPPDTVGILIYPYPQNPQSLS